MVLQFEGPRNWTDSLGRLTQRTVASVDQFLSPVESSDSGKMVLQNKAFFTIIKICIQNVRCVFSSNETAAILASRL